ncbi:MAG: membrane protein insertion efficiency factor YidD [Rhodospirillaceae bacterium]|nr:membrane protein insertion efficiency factor YidD [Rhodospirillaceae bacterium]
MNYGKKIFIIVLKIYQLLISKSIGPRCRYYPSCSNYMIQAINLHGAVNGLILGLKRISRCHPWNLGGYDPVKDNDLTK